MSSIQSAVVCGRVLARSLASLYHELTTGEAALSSRRHSHRSLASVANASYRTKSRRITGLMTASCGYSKDKESAAAPSSGSAGTSSDKHSRTCSVKQENFGDDACFLTEHKSAFVMGVADGVGGWRDYGVDPSEFSRMLMKTCELMVKTGCFSPSNPIGIISSGYKELLENKAPLVGSSTACIIVLDKDTCMLYSANLGDSGFMVIRHGAIIHRSEEQQHYFNTPFQLALAPPGQDGMVLSDRPESADTSQMDVEDGDMIFLATDGLFDNLSDAMILREVSKIKDTSLGGLQSTVDYIATKARELAYNPSYHSPFAQNAQKAGYNVTGGKPDDITALLSLIEITSDG